MLPLSDGHLAYVRVFTIINNIGINIITQLFPLASIPAPHPTTLAILKLLFICQNHPFWHQAQILHGDLLQGQLEPLWSCQEGVVL